MLSRRSLRWSVMLGIVMIVLLVALTVGWVLLAVFGAMSERGLAPLYWTLLSVGTVSLVVVLAGVVIYLILSVKTINLNRRQSNFMDSITHELKSPIASLKLYLQTLNRRPVSGEQRESFYRFMLDDVERLDDLINHLLDAARVERSDVDAQQENVELSTLLEECAQWTCLRYRVDDQTVCVEAEPCVVRARRVDLEIIFRNLVDNAVKYAGTPPRVEVTARPRPDNEIIIRIRDNGRGIPLRLRRKIFGRFVRLGLELRRHKPGMGLGLYIVRTLVRRLGGRIRVQDAENGPGTVFEVYLPGTPAPRPEPQSPQPRSPTEVPVV